MLLHYGIPTEGRNVVVLGRGPTLGRPLSLLLGGVGVMTVAMLLRNTVELAKQQAKV